MDEPLIPDDDSFYVDDFLNIDASVGSNALVEDSFSSLPGLPEEGRLRNSRLCHADPDKLDKMRVSPSPLLTAENGSASSEASLSSMPEVFCK